MFSNIRQLHYASAYMALIIMVAGCTSPAVESDIAAVNSAPNPLVLTYDKGQLLSFIAIDIKEGDAATAARDKYYETAFPLASQYGLSRDAGFAVQAVPVGDFKPAAVALFSWPDEAAEQSLYALPEWPAIKALRPKAWDELRVYTDELEENLTLTFHPEKTYTFATAWLSSERPDDYARYMAGIQTAVTESGGRFIYEMYNPKFEAHATSYGAPGQLTLVEWESPASLETFQKSAGFKASAQFLSSGTTRFELVLLSLDVQ